MIPEFSGRIPVVATLNELSRDDLVRILVEPRNALVRQYEKLFGLENVKLKFQDDAVQAIASSAYDKDTGARGLRAIIEEVMLDLMFDIPSRSEVKECVITPGVISKKEEPLIVYEHASSDSEQGGRSSASA